MRVGSQSLTLFEIVDARPSTRHGLMKYFECDTSRVVTFVEGAPDTVAILVPSTSMEGVPDDFDLIDLVNVGQFDILNAIMCCVHHHEIAPLRSPSMLEKRRRDAPKFESFMAQIQIAVRLVQLGVVDLETCFMRGAQHPLRSIRTYFHRTLSSRVWPFEEVLCDTQQIFNVESLRGNHELNDLTTEQVTRVLCRESLEEGRQLVGVGGGAMIRIGILENEMEQAFHRGQDTVRLLIHRKWSRHASGDDGSRRRWKHRAVLICNVDELRDRKEIPVSRIGTIGFVMTESECGGLLDLRIVVGCAGKIGTQRRTQDTLRSATAAKKRQVVIVVLLADLHMVRSVYEIFRQDAPLD